MAGTVSGRGDVRRSLSRITARAGLLVTLSVVVAVCSLTVGCGGGEDGAARSSEEEARVPSVTMSDTLAAEGTSDERGGSALTESGGIPVLLDLGADKCVPCKMMAPMLEEMKVTFVGQLDVRFIDVWKDAAAAREHGVRVIPTQIFFDEEGYELFRHQGFFSREDMLAKWAELGYVFEG